LLSDQTDESQHRYKALQSCFFVQAICSPTLSEIAQSQTDLDCIQREVAEARHVLKQKGTSNA
jgi:hypothetical protein